MAGSSPGWLCSHLREGAQISYGRSGPRFALPRPLHSRIQHDSQPYSHVPAFRTPVVGILVRQCPIGHVVTRVYRIRIQMIDCPQKCNCQLSFLDGILRVSSSNLSWLGLVLLRVDLGGPLTAADGSMAAVTSCYSATTVKR